MPMSQAAALDSLCINTIRTLAIDAIEKANSGHPGLPLGAAPMAYALWQNHLAVSPAAPQWPNRDRFVLSAGHGSMLQYALLHLYGFDLTLEELRNFRQLGSKTPGHPELGVTPGVEATTGPLGQGAANAVGMAICERYLAARFNRPGHGIVDHYTYALLGDGDVMEGIAAEAASLAGHLGLGKLIYLYDSNDVSLDGPCSMHFTEDVGARYESCGWQVLTVADGDEDLASIDEAIRTAKAEAKKPTLIIVKTTIGFGSPSKAGTAASHGAPLGADECAATKEALGWTLSGDFQVPRDARDHVAQATERNAALERDWQKRFEAWSEAHPELASEWELAWSGQLPPGALMNPPAFETGDKVATRAAGGKVLNAFAKDVPWLFGGDADLSCSTKTALSDEEDFHGQTTPGGRNVRYGVREHAMGAIANGIAYHGGARTYTGTFFVFSDYMRPSIRLAAMNHLPVTFVFTHDSVAVGEDGPTHQPIEHLMSLRTMPGLNVLRPCDAHETVEAWRMAIEAKDRPTALILSRQGLPTLDRDKLASAELARRGGYVLSESVGALRAILIATGAEVHIALEAKAELAAQRIGVRVVSMPSWELFEEQDDEWKESVLPANVTTRVSIEAGSTFGWERYVGTEGTAIGIDRFGASAPGGVLLDHFGFTTENLVRTVRALLGNEVLS